MPVFELSDFAAEALVLWLVWSGVGWVGLAAYRFRSRGLDAINALLLLAAPAGWFAALWLTTGFLGGRDIVPLELVRLLWGSLPQSTVVLFFFVAATLLLRRANGSTARVGITLLALVALPALALPWLTRGSEGVSLMSDPLPRTVAAPPPPAPLTDPRHPDMILVPEGPFIMGTLHPGQLEPILGNPDGDEQPVRTVYLDAFYIDRTEVTNSAFARFVDATGHVTDAERSGQGLIWGPDGWFAQLGADWRHPMGPGDSIVGLDDHPVVQVSWNDAHAYCAWTNKRLPREAEWEKAARGTDGRDYPWGTSFEPKKLNYCDAGCTQLPQHNDPTASDGFARTAPVGSFPDGASPYGMQDAVGNVWEWVEDWYDAGYYSYMPAINPPGPERSAGVGADRHKVVRGGSWTSESPFTRTTSRSYDPPESSYFGVGFRCAADP